MMCQAYTAAGNPCSRPATHEHVTQIGTRVYVCGSHLRVLTKRERNGSDEEKLSAWGVAPTPTPSPGQTTPAEPLDPSP